MGFISPNFSNPNVQLLAELVSKLLLPSIERDGYFQVNVSVLNFDAYLEMG